MTTLITPIQANAHDFAVDLTTSMQPAYNMTEEATNNLLVNIQQELENEAQLILNMQNEGTKNNIIHNNISLSLSNY